MSQTDQPLKNIIEAALLTADRPLPVEKLTSLFEETRQQPQREEIERVLDELAQDYSGRGIELKKVSSGYRVQATSDMAPWLNNLTEEKTPRYSRALLETLALIAYRQPITRAGVEDIRGVSVSSNIIKTLLEREWIRVVGHRDVPGKPALYGTTRQFLDYFNLQSLSDLPVLAEMRSIEVIQQEFDLKFDNELQQAMAIDAENSDILSQDKAAGQDAALIANHEEETPQQSGISAEPAVAETEAPAASQTTLESTVTMDAASDTETEETAESDEVSLAVVSH